MNPLMVLITGGARRVGRELGLYLAARGWDVVIHYNESFQAANALSESLRSLYPDRTFPVVQANLSNAAECTALMSQIPHLDALINNASVFEPGLLAGTDEAFFRRQMAVNFDAPFFLMQAFFRRFKHGGIVNMLDTRVSNNDSSYGAYSLAKKSLMEVTKLAALEWAPDVRVNGVAPGPVLPPEGKSEAHFMKVVAATPLKRQVSMDNLCSSVNFLLINEDVTGQIIYCDGGSHLMGV